MKRNKAINWGDSIKTQSLTIEFEIDTVKTWGRQGVVINITHKSSAFLNAGQMGKKSNGIAVNRAESYFHKQRMILPAGKKSGS
ncbi:hypothetical protein DID77_03940 [Candidatus Marinamargulisbacteria bacterium SCGC AG-439-L15]|nr:hypothetical protein DID77_03940 [Candidatus Marinamargulisbacteria bacterium SCGC AG-439-L15]